MFEIPDAKRVRREDLYASSSDGDDDRDEQVDSALRSKLNAHLSSLLDLDFSPGDGALEASDASPVQQQLRRENPPDEDDAPGGHDANPEEAEEEPLEFTFRLFRDEDPTTHKIVLENAEESTEAAGDGGFVVAKRPTSYYLAEPASQQSMERFRISAVSFEHIINDARSGRRWGLEKPWKVTTITVTKRPKGEGILSPSAGGANLNDESGATKKKRPGKKRRITMRTREKAKKEKAATAKQQLVDKEQHLLDKKKRLNRQKKLKRRLKAREEKKLAAGADGQDAASDASSREDSPVAAG